MSRIFVAIIGLALAATVLHAQNLGVIEQRRNVMGNIAKASIKNFAMSKGDAPFDLSVLQANIKTMRDEMAKFKTLFPENSKTGGETDAAPKIWQAKSEFDAAIDKFQNVAQSIAGAVKDDATLKAEYPKMVREGCNSCHKEADGFAPRLGESMKKMKQ